MILEAANEFDIDLSNSWMIGDKPADIDAGKNAGTKTALVLTGYGREHAASLNDRADYIGENLETVANFIIRETNN